MMSPTIFEIGKDAPNKEKKTIKKRTRNAPETTSAVTKIPTTVLNGG